ncbi:hypothetical protein BGX27_004592 [Mortierella sp. AM989]|nr:hypothetical protein BGX27_004592 [Mortierella sp. AM989]
MSRLLTKVATLATLALGLLSTADALGTAVTYNGTLCADYVDYQVWVPPNVTTADIERSLVARGLTKDTASFDVRFACKSTCQAAVSQCSEILNSVGKGSAIPNCDIAIPGTTALSPNGIFFQPDGACNAVKSKAGSGNGAGTGSGNHTVSCPPPFVRDPTNGANHNCMLGCCLPCPAQYSLYREGALETGFKITNTLRAVSMVLSFILMLSYIFLPDKRSHPSALILYFSICVFLFSVVVIFPLIDTRAMQCVDAITPSTQKNNLKCAIQGGILIFASVSTCAWCTALIINLHLHTVWNSAWFAKKYWLIHTICWGFAIGVTTAALALGEVKWEYATLCLISQDKASVMFFYPMAAMIFPAFLVHIATFVHIARISAQAGGDSETMSRSTLSAGAAAVISHRRHVMMAIKIQWRAAVMAIMALMCVMFYWLFYFLQLGKIKPETLGPHVAKFAGCLMKGGSHDSCVDVLAEHLPPYGVMIAAESLVSLIGTCIFVVFFKTALIGEWRDWFGSIGYLLSGKRRQKKEEDQFFVI